MIPRLVLAALCLAGVAASVANYEADRSAREKAETFSAKYGLGLRVQQLQHRIEYEFPAEVVYSNLGRQALADMTGAISLGELEPRVREAWLSVVERGDSYLEDARGLCLAGLRRHPASGDDLFCVGATTFASWYRRSDPRLKSERAVWRQPLALAAAREPGADDVAAFRAEAELETWEGPAASDREIFRRAFRKPEVFNRLFPLYTEASGGVARSRDLIPDALPQRQFALDYLAARGDVEAYFEEAPRLDEACEREADRLMKDMADAHLGGREDRAGRAAAEFIRSIPLASPRAEGLVRALEHWPEERTENWTESRRADAVGFLLAGRERLLTRAAIDRTLETTQDAPPHVVAQLRLLEGEVGEAERVERGSRVTKNYDWWPYWLAKANLLADRGDILGARRALESLAPGLRSAFDTQLAEERVSALEGKPRPAPAGRAAYAAGEWGLPSGNALEAGRTGTLFVETPPGHFDAQISLSSTAPTVVACGWDGDRSQRARVSHEGKLVVPGPSGRGRHRLELTDLVGGRVAPGPVVLTPSPTPPRTTSRGPEPASPRSPESQS